MLKSLQFVRGAVAQKNHVPVLRHFRIHAGRVQSHNGVLSLSAPIACDLSIQPLADTFVHAIALCDATVGLHQTETGRLAVTSGAFKAYIDTSAEDFPDIEPQGEPLEVTGLLDAIRALAPIMSDDASRPWSRGILFVKQSAYVTNNIVLVEHWLRQPVSQPFGLPAMAVNELLRIDEEPEAIQISETRVTFHFSEDRRLVSSLLLISPWPDVRRLLDVSNPDFLYDLPPSFFEALQKLRPFTKDLRLVYLHNNTLSTASDEKDGAHIVLDDVSGMRGVWTLDQLAKLENIAQKIGWDRVPKPCLFYGELMRGAIIGVADAH